MNPENYPDNLHEWAGLDAVLDETALALHWGPDVSAPPGETRPASALAPVLFDKAARSDTNPLYVVYRGVAPLETQSEMARRGMEYATLVMRAGTIGGREWTRTRGHINSPAPGTRVAYPEVHEVWHGQALLYLQKEAGAIVSDAVVIALSPGEKAVVAPGWAGLLVNVGETPLVTGSWRSTDCVLEHDALTHLGGMAHFLLQDTNVSGGCTFAPNPRYENVPVPRVVPARELVDFGLKHGEPMLTTFRQNPDYFRFMLRPQDFSHIWSRVYRDAAP